MEQNKTSGTQFLLLKNLEGILNIVLEEISDFKQTSQMKIKSVSVLSFILSQCGSKIKPEVFNRTGGILPNLFKYIDAEEGIGKKCEECAVQIGKSTDQNVLIPLIIKTISEMEPNASYQPLFVRIKFIANYLSQLQQISTDNAKMIIDTLSSLDIFNISDPNYSTKILVDLAYIYYSLINSLGANSKQFHDTLFFPLLLLNSLPETLSIRKYVEETIANLAKLCGCNSVDDLYAIELSNVLQKFQSTYKNWRSNSPDRFAFDIYIKQAGTALENHWVDVLMIISQCCESEKDIEMRMDMILLLDKVIINESLKEQLKVYIEFILKEILFPSTAWRVGRPNYKVRKAAMIDLIHLFKQGLITSEVATQFFSDFHSTLKATLDDDWDAELRYTSLLLLRELLLNLKDTMKYDNMSELYTTILKRLDDSQDSNRILTCDILIIFIDIGIRLNMSESIYEYMITNSFIHLDDPNEKVREAVEKYLESAARIHTKTFLSILEKNENSFTHKSIINDLKDKVQKYLK